MNRGWQARHGQLVWADVPRAELPVGWARLELEMGGICATDRQILQGYAGFVGVLGHEFVARVVECGDGAWLGKRVVGEINVGCGVCELCGKGDFRFCLGRRVLGIRGLDGAFGNSFCLPLVNLRAVDSMLSELAVWAEPVAAALDATKLVPVGSRVLVVGDGRLASLIALCLRSEGKPVSVLGRHAHKLVRLRKLGLEVCSDPGPSSSWPAVVEATGNAQGFRTALELVCSQGVVVVKSTFAEPATLDWSPVVVKALRIQGSRCGSIDAALNVLRSGAVDPRSLVDRVVRLEELPQGFEAMENGALKVLVSA